MTMDAVLETRDASTGQAVRTIRAVEIFHRMADAEATWRAMESADCLFSPFQRFDFLAAWQSGVGEADGTIPFIVVGFDANRRPMLLLPLGVRSGESARVASYLGGKHTTFNMPLLARDFAVSVSRAEVDELINLVRAKPDRADLLALSRQPLSWMDITNPLSLLPTQPSVNRCPLLKTAPNASPVERISSSLRRRLKSKERKLQSLPGYRYLMAESDADISRILDAFFTIKPQRMAAQKLPNVFNDPGVRDFVFAACLARLPDNRRVIEIHALECADEVIAIYAGVADGHRFSMMFNTYTISANSKYSPGLILLRYIIDHYAAQNFTGIDLGTGADDYKLMFCKDTEPLFDSFVPLTARGHVAALGHASLTRVKRLVKQTPALAQAAQVLRGALHR